MKRLFIRIATISFALTIAVSALAFAGGQQQKSSSASQAKPSGPIKIAILVKNLGNPFFDAVNQGAKEAAKALGNVDIIYQGPTKPTAEGQISIIQSLIAQKVNAIAISANDANALVPIAKKAMAAGIKVISFDSAVAPAGRILNIADSGAQLIGASEVQLLGKMINNTGEIAILSASSTATNQNTWIKYMKQELQKPQYSKMKLVAVVYGNDLADQSYRQAMGLFKKYPNLKGIISPTTVGIAATGKALEDAGLAGKIALTGLGYPPQMEKYILDGTCTAMELWNPVDLGYTAAYVSWGLVTGKFSGKPGETMSVGRMGDIKIASDGTAIMGKPFVFDKSNIAKYSKLLGG